MDGEDEKSGTVGDLLQSGKGGFDVEMRPLSRGIYSFGGVSDNIYK